MPAPVTWYAVWCEGSLMCVCTTSDDAMRIVEEYRTYLERPAYWVEWRR